MRAACSRETSSASGRSAGDDRCHMPMTTLGDLSVHFERTGNGEPVLLIHGLGSSTEDWEPQVSALAREYTVVSYDVRGHGRTAKPAGRYTLAQFADDAAKL